MRLLCKYFTSSEASIAFLNSSLHVTRAFGITCYTAGLQSVIKDFNITMTQAKAVSNYTNSILANMEALDDGYDEALLLDASGFVSEGASENVFIVKGDTIYTPDLSAGALNGITRNTILHIAKDLGIEVVQKRITRDEVYIADEAFFTGTAAEVTPIRELDRVEIGNRGDGGSRGPVTEKVQNAFFDIVNGKNPKYAHWLSKV